MDLQRACAGDARNGSLVKIGALMCFLAACLLLATSLITLGMAAPHATAAITTTQR